MSGCSGPGHALIGGSRRAVLAQQLVPMQALFELNVRLQYSDDERLLLPALLELGGAVALDMPAEALLQRQSILDLFSVRADVRRAAGQQLLRLLMGGEEQPDEELDEFEAFADDPFKGLLDSASAASAALGRQQQQHHLPLDPLTDASAALAANFTQRDVRNLLAVLQNQGLALELRRSAAEELLALSPEPQLLSVMVESQHLEAVWGLCVPAWPEDDAGSTQHHPGRAPTPTRVGAGAPSGELFDMQLAVSALQLLAGLLARSPQALAWMCGDTHSSLLARGDEADYCCRVVAGVLLHEATGALQNSAQVARLQNARDSRSSSDLTSHMGKGRGLKPAADAALAAAGSGSCGVGLSEEAAAVVDAIEPLITKVLMPVAGRSVPGFRGKALAKTALQALLEVVRGPVAAQEDWSQVWAAIGGTFWLSRLCRDRESSIRCLALRLLGQLLAPGAAATQALIAHSWPDCGHRLVRVALDTCEAHGVRAAAMRALAASMVIPVSILQQQQQQGAAGDAAGEKVKAAVRKLPAAAARLAAVRDCAQQLLEEAEEQQIADRAVARAGSSRGDIAAVSDRDGWEDQQRAAAAAGKGVGGRLHGKAVVAAAGSLAGARDAAWWLEQLAESCSSVLDIMESA
ncbi:hypothetical protein OEZ85_007180 [Tetradesmus obliquus]|uniref:Uncharacterized protein n=1 Tax=Tetradesmus obliquus TaxID=3088 RepID=A0ABY8TWX2_TETOB|nr:hypothetical protein OEZ85_007180 [Tetradesmus obliquus]